MIDDSLVYLDDVNRVSYNEKKTYSPETFRINIGGIWMKLSSNGYALLNQIRTKKALETLNKSISNFDEANQKSFDMLDKSINNFDRSSKAASNMLIAFTIVIVLATVIEVVLTVLLK